MEKGTLYHLRNVINRTSVPSDPQNNMNAAEDFLLLVCFMHIPSLLLDRFSSSWMCLQ